MARCYLSIVILQNRIAILKSWWVTRTFSEGGHFAAFQYYPADKKGTLVLQNCQYACILWQSGALILPRKIKIYICVSFLFPGPESLQKMAS